MSVVRAEYVRIFAASPKTERGFPTILNGDPKGKNFLYGFGNTVFIRNIDDPTLCDLYYEHAAQVNAAQYAPSGFYIASGDDSGKLRIWDTTQAEHILKNEFTPFGGSIKDLSWSPDNQRIVCAGDGKESFASVFLSDTGTTTGTVGGHSKAINSCDFKPTRPFRIVTGSEDMTSVLHEGPPFKFKSIKHDHQNFVQCVRFSPNGNIYVTASADKRILAYDAKEGTSAGEFKDGATAHNGSVYAVCFSPDSSKLLSVSADKTAKIWNVETFELLKTFKFGSNVNDMQVGCLWQGDHIISLSLDGQLTYLDMENVEKPKRTVRGHNKKITSMCYIKGESGDVIYTGDFLGNINRWDCTTGDAAPLKGDVKTQISGLANRGGSTVVVVSLDDTIRFIDQSSGEFVANKLSCPSQPQKVVASAKCANLAIVVCLHHLLVLNGFDVAHTVELSAEAAKVAFSSDEKSVACSMKNKKLQIYNLTDNHVLESVKEVSTQHEPMNLEFSPDGKHLAFIDASKVIRVLEVADGEYKPKCDLHFHMGRVDQLSWHSDSTHLVSAGLDTHMAVWNINTPLKYTRLMLAHPKSTISGVAWADDSTLVSCGFDDCNIKFWKPTFP